jgi:predicted Zn-dependent protease
VQNNDISIEPLLDAARLAIRNGEFRQAAAGLEQLGHAARVEPAVLQLEWLIQAEAGNWADCVKIAEAMTAARPNKAACWVALVKSLLQAGHSTTATAILELAEHRFPQHHGIVSLRARVKEFTQARDTVAD